MVIVSAAYLKRKAPEELGDQVKKGFFKKSVEFSNVGIRMADEKLLTISKGYPIEVRNKLKAKLIE